MTMEKHIHVLKIVQVIKQTTQMNVLILVQVIKIFIDFIITINLKLNIDVLLIVVLKSINIMNMYQKQKYTVFHMVVMMNN